MKNIFIGLILIYIFSCANTQTELIKKDVEETQEDAEDAIKDSHDDYKSDDIEIEVEEPIE